MLQQLCILYILGFYVSAFYTIIKHRHYFGALLRRTHSFNSSYKVHRCSFVRPVPMYRKEYFGYEYFVLADFENCVLLPDEKMRIFGILRQYNECLMVYKKDTVKTIIVLGDTRYVTIVLEGWRKVYRNILVFITGGVILWQICSQFMTF